MKFVAVFLLALIAAVCASPTSISDNNVGDIVSVGVNANLEISNKIEQNIISILVGILNQQGIIVGRNRNEDEKPEPLPAAQPDLESIVKMFLD